MWVLWIVAVIVVMVGLKLADTWDYDLIGSGMVAFAGFFLLISLICWPVEYYSHKASIAAYPDRVSSIEAARRGEISEYERMALTKDIMDFNVNLRKAQYWNETFMFDMYIPDEIMQLEPIR